MSMVEEIIEELQGSITWISNHKKAGWTHEGRCNEEDMAQLHELAWQLVNITRTEEEVT
tara:strand:+ start:268 stop:444 length:177 start_codon:yes stop_codon:yes gene_type:complete